VKESSNHPEIRWLVSFAFRISAAIVESFSELAKCPEFILLAGPLGASIVRYAMLGFLLMVDQNRTGSAMHDLRCFMLNQEGSEKCGRPAAGNDQVRIDLAGQS